MTVNATWHGPDGANWLLSCAQVFDGQGELLRTLPPAPKDALDPDRVTTLTRETVSRGDQVRQPQPALSSRRA